MRPINDARHHLSMSHSNVAMRHRGPTMTHRLYTVTAYLVKRCVDIVAAGSDEPLRVTLASRCCVVNVLISHRYVTLCIVYTRVYYITQIYYCFSSKTIYGDNSTLHTYYIYTHIYTYIHTYIQTHKLYNYNIQLDNGMTTYL